MLNQLLLGSTIIVITVIVQVIFFNIAIDRLTRIGQWLSDSASFLKTSFIMVIIILWTLLGITVSTWIWAVLFKIIGALETFDEAYFATVTFTTLGYGDITLTTEWRLLSGLTAVNGLIIFGLNTAFLVQFVEKTRGLHIKKSTTNRE